MNIPKYSRAAVVREFKKPLEIENVQIPETIEPEALLVKIKKSSICGTDIHLWQGNLNLDIHLPVILGHEMVGEIVAIGENADRDSVGQPLALGDRVIWAHADCGSCHYCTVEKMPTLCTNRRQYMYETMEEHPYLMGGFSEYGYVLPKSGRVKVPDSVSDSLASLCSCAFRSVMHAIRQLGEVKHTDNVVVQGTGPLGLLAISVLKVAGAAKIIAIGAPENRLAIAKEMGADEIISIDEVKDVNERIKQVLELTDGLGPDIVLEFSGFPGAVAEGLQFIKKNGKYLIVGQLSDGETTIQPSLITKKNIQIIGSYSGDISDYHLALKFVEMHQDRFPFHKLITNEYSLDEINEALTNMKNLKEIKPIINIGG
ncbi:MAG: zinc-binding dehydrogenase [Bacilli bacterium]|nr:zinc-binding dehydrogenase [Bacilli bacterium]